ncbi:MAG: ClbS/DfsB family four-helix bundle protein [Bacteroidota bacterium]
MARPKNKQELLSLSESSYQQLLAYVDALSPEQQALAFPPATLNRNIRDVLGHLHHWHLLLLGWTEVAAAGERPQLPAPGHTWKSTPALNREINAYYATTPLVEVRQMLADSYQRVRQIIMNHTEEELFTKCYYKWTGSTSLGAYLISATSSHYDWGFKLIKRSMKAILPT